MIRTYFWLYFMCVRSYSYAQHNPNFDDNRTVIAVLFQWKFTDIAIECEKYLGPLNFGGVQVSPVSENLQLDGSPWYERYQPMSYIIMSRSGNENEFIDMTKRCNAAGIRVFVDIVMNHMAKPLPNITQMIGTAGSVAGDRIYPSVPYNVSDFHRPCSIDHFFEAHMVRNCDLYGLPDLDQSIPNVRSKIIAFLNRLIKIGVTGFRMGACKHMWPNDLMQIYAKINNVSTDFGLPANRRPFIYQDVFDIGVEPLSKYEYNFLGVVTEYMYSMVIGKIFTGILTLESVRNWGPNAGLLQSDDAMVFIDNHDLQRHLLTDQCTISFRQPRLLGMATAFMLSLPYGIPAIMSSFEFSSNDHGPPTDKNGGISSPHGYDSKCLNDWVCEHRWPVIVNMVEFRRETTGNPLRRWQQFSEHKIAFCRGRVGLVVITVDANSDFNETVKACVSPGVYCDMVAGKDEWGHCKNIVIVREDRTALIHIQTEAEYGMVVISIGSKLS